MKSNGSPSTRPVVVLVSGDTAGWITPCGCTSNQSGGMPRRASYVADVRKGAEVLYADAGGAPGGASDYDRLKFEAILRGEAAMGVSAHNVGGPEAALGAKYLTDLAARAPLVTANVRDSVGHLLAPAIRVASVGGRRIAFAGVLSPKFATRDLRVDEPRSALLAAIPAVRNQYDALVVLAYLPEDELQELAAALPEADAIVGGPTGQTLAPRRVGPTLLTSATNKGKFLARLDVPAALPGEWNGSIVELDAKWADEPAQVKNVAQYLADLAKRDFAASQTNFSQGAVNAAALPANYRVAGSQACAGCHAPSFKLWKATGHASAWAVLEAKHSHVDPACQVCHTTGYGLPGGFSSVAQGAEFVAVGCESCHGPSQAHVTQPTVHTPYAARDQCTRCHDRENSPTFDYNTFWTRIAHGPDKPVGPDTAVMRDPMREVGP